jgi:hypothetical protein
MPSEKLEFQKQEPAFLRKLREQHGGPRNNVQIARPKKDRLRTGEDGEDDPVIVDEAGEDVAKEEWEARLKREKEGADHAVNGEVPEDDEGAAGSKTEATHDKQKTADIGAVKKRKAGKVIADDEVEQDSAKVRDGSSLKQKADEVNGNETATTVKSKKKAKKIKLSFDEPE